MRRLRRNDKIILKMDFKETVLGDVHWTELAEERFKWRAFVNS